MDDLARQLGILSVNQMVLEGDECDWTPPRENDGGVAVGEYIVTPADSLKFARAKIAARNKVRKLMTESGALA